MTAVARFRASLARMIAPSQPLQVRRFESQDGGWTPISGGRVATDTLAVAGTMRRHARRVYGEDPHAKSAVEAWTVALIGTGARATPTHPDPDARGAITSAIDRWSESCDLDGVADWYGLQASLARAMVIDGEALATLVDTPEGLRLRQLPAELLAEEETRDLGGGAQIVAGVEFDSYGRRVAYWIRPELPTAAWAGYAAARRVSADDVIHLFRPLGAGQVRGVSWLAPILAKLSDVGDLSEAILRGFKISALHAGFIEDATNLGGALPYEGDQQGGVVIADMEPGTIKVVPAGKTIKFNSPQQAQQAPEFLNAELRAVAVGMGVPSHLITGDLSKTNYSSIRADLVAFRQRYEAVQYGPIAHQLLRRVHGRAVASLILSGDLDAPGFESDPRAWTAAEFLFPAPPWIDPAKDAAAYRDLIDAGLMSRTQAAAERGWSVEALDAEIAADRAREASLGLTFGGRAATPQNEEDTSDD
ncbi:phage portal protein [Brevundimonas sp. VNH65]|uniref:phage portal protein n=1 Tax=Brevundimonas sp. VNH65 TaxID=3400917 RepID=UPI003C075A73